MAFEHHVFGRALMSGDEIRARNPDPCPASHAAALAAAGEVMAAAGCGGPNQQMGQRWPVGCVALEITQRCNLDCTLCYLSEHSEAVLDLPLAEVFRRIDLISRHYGRDTDVQITGGDPTLRRRGELLAIVARVRELNMRPTLMTNGRKASRALLAELAACGLADVAFHVDTTQRRKGFATEEALNAVRTRYLERARGLGLSVMFNTTVHEGNLHEIPMLVGFFRRHAAEVRTASFQLQADTGRGVLGARHARVTTDAVARGIQTGAGIALNFNGSRAGHPGCNRYAMGFEANGGFYDLLDDTELVGKLQQATAGLTLGRQHPSRMALAAAGWAVLHPQCIAPALRLALRKFREAGADLLAARGRAHTLSFFIHDFMDACALDRERIDACVFKTMTRDGPISMCLHNARRDDFILQPIAVSSSPETRHWQPLTGETGTGNRVPGKVGSVRIPRKRLKGRARAQSGSGGQVLGKS